MIFRTSDGYIEIKRVDYRNDLDYYRMLYTLLTNQTDNVKTTPVNKILSAMFIE